MIRCYMLNYLEFSASGKKARLQRGEAQEAAGTAKASTRRSPACDAPEAEQMPAPPGRRWRRERVAAEVAQDLTRGAEAFKIKKNHAAKRSHHSSSGASTTYTAPGLRKNSL